MITAKVQGDNLVFWDEKGQIMTMEEDVTDSGVLIRLSGQLRSETAPHIRAELDAFTTVGMKIILDFGEVTYAAPSVLDALQDVENRIEFFCRGGLLLRNISDEVYREMDEAGITELVPMEA